MVGERLRVRCATMEEFSILWSHLQNHLFLAFVDAF
jgi:hypothetical protein